MRRKIRKRFHQIFWAHLRRVQGRLILAALFTLGVTATELLKPWPLKMIVDHAILDKPLPHCLSFLSGIVEGSKITLVVQASCAIVLIALCGGMFAIMFALNWKVGLIPLATMPFLCFSLFHLYRKTKVSVKKQKRQEGRVASRMTEVLSAIPLVQAFGREKYEEEKFDAVTAETLQESIRIARLEAAATRSSQIITALGTAAAVLFGALQVLHDKMLPGELVLVVAYLNNLYKPLRGVAKLSTDFSKAMASADRISEILDLEPKIKDRPDAIEADSLRGEIVFDN